MSYVITGATGHLGRLVVESLLDHGVEPGQIVATGRDLSRIADLAERGVQTRVADYDDPDSLRSAFDGADKVLLVSGSEIGNRIEGHRNAIEAAKAAGVSLVAYTSIAGAGHTDILLALDHQATEQLLAESGVPYALLRNGLYLEVYTAQLPTYLEHGVAGSAGDGRLSAAARADLAQAAAVILLSDDAAGQVYELAGDDAFTLAELASTLAEVTGKPVAYHGLSGEQHREVLLGAGLPAALADVFADIDRGIANGDLHVTTGDLGRLLGRHTTTLEEAVRQAALVEVA